MTARDREATLKKYNEMFETAPNEDDFLAKLGSPTRAAICELRGYVPTAEESSGESPDAAGPDMPAAEVPDAQAAPEGLIEPEPMPEAITESPGPAPDAADEATAVTVTEARPQEAPAVEETPEEAAEEPPAPDSCAEEPEAAGEPEVLFDFAETEETPAPVKPQKPRAIGGRLALYILFGIVAGIPATAVLIALCLCVLAVGALLIASGIFVISLGFVGMTVFADIIMLFGAGLIIASLGVPIAFSAFWIFTRVVVGFVNLILRTGGTWCYEHTKEAQK